MSEKNITIIISIMLIIQDIICFKYHVVRLKSESYVRKNQQRKKLTEHD